jgi:ribosome-associated protein
MGKIDFLKLARHAARVADDKKGKDIVILNVKRLTVVANYFLIVTAESTVQTRAILDSIFDALKQEDGVPPLRREGVKNATWSVLDYGGLVIHVMMPEARALYSLEKVWADARKV